jgi:hypothetical protein
MLPCVRSRNMFGVSMQRERETYDTATHVYELRHKWKKDFIGNAC